MTGQELIKKYGLRGPQSTKKFRLVCSGEGDPGSGKTDFFLRTGPRKQLVVNIDQNLEAIEERRVGDKGRDIMIMDVPFRMNIDQQVDLDTFKKIRDCSCDALASGYNVMIDEGNQYYELCRRGYHGTLDFGEIPQSQFTIVNTNMRKIYRTAKMERSSLYVPHRLKDERKDGINAKSGKKTSNLTGNRVMGGWKETEFEVHVHVRFEKQKNWVCSRPSCEGVCKKREAHSIERFTMEIVKCTRNQSIEGIKLEGRDITWSNLGHMVFPASEDVEDAWT